MQLELMFIVTNAGLYEVSFLWTTSTGGGNGFELFINDAATTNLTKNGTNSGNQQTNGHAIVQLAAGDQLSLANSTTVGTLTLDSSADSVTPPNVSAAMVIVQLS
jgi:hypothetical protein